MPLKWFEVQVILSQFNEVKLLQDYLEGKITDLEYCQISEWQVKELIKIRNDEKEERR